MTCTNLSIHSQPESSYGLLGYRLLQIEVFFSRLLKNIIDHLTDVRHAIVLTRVFGFVVLGNLQPSQEFFASTMNASSWGDVWAGIRLGCV
jgi:hypothetical protein